MRQINFGHPPEEKLPRLYERKTGKKVKLLKQQNLFVLICVNQSNKVDIIRHFKMIDEPNERHTLNPERVQIGAAK